MTQSQLHPLGHRLVRRPAGFTLIELMVAIAIIVLLLGLAVLAFNSITGNRSIEAAVNVLQSVMTRVQQEAVGVQKTRGLAVFVDPATDRVALMPVQAPAFSPWVGGHMYTAGDYVYNSGDLRYYYCFADYTAPINPPAVPPTISFDSLGTNEPIDATGHDEVTLFLPGIGLQMMYTPATGARIADGYTGFGVILFDALGRTTSADVSSGGVGGCIYYNGKLASDFHLTSTTINPGAGNPKAYNFFSVPVVVLFDRTAFKSNGFSDGDPVYGTSGGAAYVVGGTTNDELHEETWLDQNAQPYLISRYNGSLVKGE